AGFTFKVGVYTYHHGNICNTTHVWRIDKEASEEEIVDQHYKIQTDLKKYLPTYHTRHMCREYMDICELHLNKQPKAKLRCIYKELTNDASVAKTTNLKEVDERVKLAFELNDPKIISDLRELNEGKKFLEGIAQEVVVAVDEKRHDPIVHLAQAISACDL
ncbi:6297_t:CDS:2, partial [Racocetra persica]